MGVAGHLIRAGVPRQQHYWPRQCAAHLLDTPSPGRQIRQSRNYSWLPVRQRATHEKRSRSYFSGWNDGTGRAEVEAYGDVLGGEIVRSREILNAALFFVISFFSQCWNNVKENEKYHKDQKKCFYCCKHGVWHKSSGIYCCFTQGLTKKRGASDNAPFKNNKK